MIFGFSHSERYPDAEPVLLTTLINPQIEYLGTTESLGREDCLSVPGLRGEVPRPTRIRYRGLSTNATT